MCTRTCIRCEHIRSVAPPPKAPVAGVCAQIVALVGEKCRCDEQRGREDETERNTILSGVTVYAEKVMSTRTYNYSL